MKRALFSICLLAAPVMAETPFHVTDTATQGNLSDLDRRLSKHRHNNDGSTRLMDALPDTDSTYDLGASGREWAALYVDTAIASVSSGFGYPMNCRLTLQSGVAIPAAAQAARTVIYLTPYKGNMITAYDGSKFVSTTFTEISTNVAGTAAQMYDLFFTSFSTLEQVAWTNDTTRATAISSTTGGLWTKSGDAARIFVGCYRTTVTPSGQTEDSVERRFLWNCYNRVIRPMRILEATNSWTYSTAAWRQANGSTGNQLDFIRGLDEDVVTAIATAAGISSGASFQVLTVGIGLDSTTAISGESGVMDTNSSSRRGGTAHYTALPGIGRHFLAWLEYGGGADTQTWYGDNGGSFIQTGIQGWVAN